MGGESSQSGCWSTADVDQSRAFEYWVDTICDRFLKLEIDSSLRNRFRARLEQIDLGSITVNLIEARCQRVRRTHEQITSSGDPFFILLQLRVGEMRLRHHGHFRVVAPEECVFLDSREPYEIDESASLSKAVALQLPERWLRRWLPRPERLAAHVFSGGGWNRPLNAALAALDAESARHLALPNDVVAEQLVALLALAAGAEAAPACAPKRLDRLRQALVDRLEDSELSPSVVATELGMSTRSVHYAFARAGTTFMNLLMQLRGERAAQILSDRRLVDLPMTEVAARCGFADPSHFARRFRAQFGQSPLAFRNATLPTKS